MTIEELLTDKTKKAKEKVEIISNWLLDGSRQADELLIFSEKLKVSEKATCIEAVEFATKQNPEIAEESVFTFMTISLTENAPRIKWESAKVIGNTAHLFPAKLEKTINHLLINSEHEGTVVRWASAYALGEILKLKTRHNKNLLPAIESICNREKNNGVKKKYFDAIKNLKN